MITVKLPVAVAATFLWIGFVCAISFMEAWLKFRAPGVTLPLGLGIGRIVFQALNKVEWTLAILICINLLFSREPVFTARNLTFFIPWVIVILQTFWLLPALDARAEMHIQGLPVPSSNFHWYYVGMEIVKVIALSAWGISLFKPTDV